MKETSGHGWSGMKCDNLARYPAMEVRFQEKYIDRKTGCEYRSGEWSRHRKEITTNWNRLTEDCDVLRQRGETLVHQFRNNFLVLHFEYLQTLARRLFGPKAHHTITNEDGSVWTPGMLPSGSHSSR